MVIRAVVFDLGNVFVDVVHARAAQTLAKFCPGGPQRLQDAIATSPLLHRIERGEMEDAAFFTELGVHASCFAPYDDFRTAFCDIFIPVPEMIAVNARLRARGTPTYLCSNTNALHFQYLRNNHVFMSDFDDCFLSYKVGSMKPDDGIYEAVERGTGRSGGALLFIDDKLENLVAAAARGWDVIHHLSPAGTIDQMRALGLL